MDNRVNQKIRKRYLKPRVESVKLRPSEEVLALGCKNVGLTAISSTQCTNSLEPGYCSFAGS